MKEAKKNYVAPQMEVMEARVEQGFAGSGNGINSDLEHVHDNGSDIGHIFD